MDGNIYLIGMMGAGKTTFGRRVAALSGLEFMDLDEEIERAALMSIPEIFSSKGESWFRDIEAATLAKVSRVHGRVVATGGGVVLKEENVRVMKETGRVFFLSASVPDLARRLEGSWNRPLLHTPDWRQRLADLLEEREPLYKASCDFVVESGVSNEERVARDILSRMESSQ